MKNKNSGLVVLGGSVCTEYGLNVTKSLIAQLGGKGIHIISGLETDISLLAINTALRTGTKVSGYLAGNINIARKIFSVEKTVKKLINSKNGTLYVPSEPDKSTKNPFFNRDRVMIKKSSGVLVIEALLGSRIFHAVEYAIEIGKPIFAVPGNVFSYTNKGVNLLLQTVATLVENYSDINII